MSHELELELQKLRHKMDDQNLEVAEVLLQRLALAQQIHNIKKKLGLEKSDRAREEVILMRLSQISKNRHDNKYLHQIFEEIFNSTKESLD